MSEPRTVEEAQDRIARARLSIEPTSEKLDAEPSAPVSGAAPTAPSPSQDSAAEARHEQKAEDICGVRCRALASMKRAVLALCRMTGEHDARCADAKRTLDESVTRVSSCRCEGR